MPNPLVIIHGWSNNSASFPYSWKLALQDRFGTQEFYGPGNILCTVLIGSTGYTEILLRREQAESIFTIQPLSKNS